MAVKCARGQQFGPFMVREPLSWLLPAIKRLNSLVESPVYQSRVYHFIMGHLKWQPIHHVCSLLILLPILLCVYVNDMCVIICDGPVEAKWHHLMTFTRISTVLSAATKRFTQFLSHYADILAYWWIDLIYKMYFKSAPPQLQRRTCSKVPADDRWIQ